MESDLPIQHHDDFAFTPGGSWPAWTNGPSQAQEIGLSNNGSNYDGQPLTVKSGPGLAANRASVSVACVSCRSRHLKCDGAVRCSRCKADGTECSYVKSRRGWKGPRRAKLHQATNADQAASRQVSSRQASTTSIDVPPTGNHQGSSPPTLALTGSAPQTKDFMSVSTVSLPESPSYSDRSLSFGQPQYQLSEQPLAAYVKQYYEFFATAHPILPPQALTERLIKDHGLVHLRLAMQYVACRYTFPSASLDLKNELWRTLSEQEGEHDGYLVQSMLLFAIGLHANDEPEYALEALDNAITVALQLGMNNARYAVQAGCGNPVLEESWRRTWWQLFVLNAFFAGINKQSDFRLRSVETDVPLPCEEKDFASSHIPPSETVDSYETAVFSSDDKCFSSFAYMIHAAKILGSVLQIDPSGTTDKLVHQADTALSAWTLNLPFTKREAINRNGIVDEVLLQAQMIVACANIMLHRPRSALEVNPVGDIKTCVTPGEFLGTTQAREVHTVKAIKAAEDLSELMRLPSPLNKRSPFFTCAVVMASVVHLSYWSFIVPDGEDSPIKDLIRLDTGALRHLSTIWPIAGTCLGQVKGVAQEMFASKKAVSLHTWNTMHGEFQRMIEESGVRQIEGARESSVVLANS